MFNFLKKKKEETFNVSDTQEFKDFISEIGQHNRDTWIPVTSQSECEFSTDSKFGGLPYIDEENQWPVCSNCEKHMTFFTQINMSEIPEHDDTGLIQLFYCTNSEKMCDDALKAWAPFSKGSMVRLIEKVSEQPMDIEHNAVEVFPEKKIIKWNIRNDYPHVEDYPNKLNKAFDLVPDESYQKYVAVEEEKVVPMVGEKVFGWPYWVQGAEYPNDPNTGEKMDFLIQIDSNTNIPWMFGDVGVGHITRSKTDKNLLAFGWACS